jgi:malic enzyme
VFRGALEVRARTINEEMKLAAARAIARVSPGARSSLVASPGFRVTALRFRRPSCPPKSGLVSGTSRRHVGMASRTASGWRIARRVLVQPLAAAG